LYSSNPSGLELAVTVLKNPQSKSSLRMNTSTEISTINKFYSNKHDLYEEIAQRGYYLPSFASSAITVDYLCSVITHKVFRIERSSVKLGYMINKRSISELVGVLRTVTANSKPLGFDEYNFPDEEWLLNTIFTLAPDHSIFSYGDGSTPAREFPSELLSEVRVYRSKGRGLYKRTHKEFIEYAKAKKEKQVQKKKRQIDRIKSELVRANRKFQETAKELEELKSVGEERKQPESRASLSGPPRTSLI